MLTERELLLGERGKPTLRPKTYAWCPDTPARGYQSAGHCLKDKDNMVPFVKRKALFLLRLRHPLFLLETSGSFCKFNSFLFICLFLKKILLKFYLFIYSFPTIDFDGMWTYRRLFHISRLGNRVHCKFRGSPCGVVPNLLDSDIVASESELQTRYYVHFWTNAFGKGMNSPILPAIGWIEPLFSLYKDGIDIK